MKNKNYSLNFIIGYIVSNIEYRVNDFLKILKDNNSNDFTIRVDLPYEWFKFNTKKDNKIRVKTLTYLSNIFTDYKIGYDSQIISYPKEYIMFRYKFSKKEPIKEMTLSEIEEALGYKVKIKNDTE